MININSEININDNLNISPEKLEKLFGISDKKLQQLVLGEIYSNQGAKEQIKSQLNIGVQKIFSNIGDRLNLIDEIIDRKQGFNFYGLSTSDYRSIKVQSDMIDKNIQTIEKNIGFGLMLGIDTTEIRKQLKHNQLKLSLVQSGIGDFYEGYVAGEGGSLAKENTRKGISNLRKGLYEYSVDFCFKFLSNVHQNIEKNMYRSETVKQANSKYIRATNRLLLAKINRIQDPELKRKTKIKFVETITGRSYDINNELKDSALALQVLDGMIDKKDGILEKIIEKENIEFKDENLNDSPKQVVGDFVENVNIESGPATNGVEFIKLIQFGDILNLPQDTSYDQLSPSQKIKISTLNLLNKKISEQRRLKKEFGLIDLRNALLEISKEQVGKFNAAIKENIDGKAFKSIINIDSNYKPRSGKYYGFEGDDAKIYDLYKDIFGLGFDLSDESINFMNEVGKMGLVIGGSIIGAIAAAPITSGMSIVGGGAFLGGMIGLTSVASSSLVYGQGYETFDDAFKDLGSDALVSSVTGAFGGAYAAKLMKNGAGIMGSEQFKRLMFNAGVTGSDMMVGFSSEMVRQKYFMDKDISIIDLLENGGIFMLIAVIAGSYKGEKGFYKHGEGAKKLIDYEIKGDQLVLGDVKTNDVNSLNYVINRLILENGLKGVKIKDGVNSTTKETINNIISKNFPLLEVIRLNEGNKIANINIGGVKKLNDKLGQSFVDDIIFEFESILKKNFRAEQFDDKGHYRLVRSEYKNISFSMPDGKPVRFLFNFSHDQKYLNHLNKTKNISSFDDINLDFDEFMDYFIYKIEHKIIQAASKEGITKLQAEQLIRNNFSFGIGTSRIEVGMASDIDKLKAFYQAEISSRDGIINSSNPEFRANNFMLDKIRNIGQSANKIKTEIIETYKDKMFTFKGVEYSVLVRNIDGNFSLNPKLLRWVRKGEKLQPNDLSILVKSYLDSLNKGFDFISPLRDQFSSFKDAIELNNLFKNLSIKPEFFKDLYKGTLNKAGFMAATYKKKGLRVFIDIEDMGIENIKSFQKISDVISNYKGSDIDDVIGDLLSGGDEVTIKFLHFVKQLKSQYPTAKLSLGGDEIYIFIPGTNLPQDKIIQTLSNDLRSSQLIGRMTSKLSGGNTKAIFEHLDATTKLSKAIKGKFEQALSSGLIGNGFQNTSIKLLKNVTTGDSMIEALDDALSDDQVIKNISKLKEGGKENLTMKISDGPNTFNFEFSRGEGGLLNVYIR